MNIANSLTMGRLIAIPIMMALFFIPYAWAAWLCLLVYIAAAITDGLDGYIARKYNQISKFGVFLDPIADKIFVMAVIIMLVSGGAIHGIWLVPAMVILAREFLISGLREYLGPKNIQVPVSKLAKWKTGVQMTALGFLVIGEHGNTIVPFTPEIGLIGLLVASVLTIVTGWHYMKVGMQHID